MRRRQKELLAGDAAAGAAEELADDDVPDMQMFGKELSPALQISSVNGDRCSVEGDAPVMNISHISNEQSTPRENEVDDTPFQNELQRCKTELRRLIEDNKRMRILNEQLQAELLTSCHKIRATLRSVENVAKVGSIERVEMGANLPVGYVDTVKNKVHAGHGWWIDRSPYDLLRRKINITPRKFILNAAVLIFGEHVLKKSSVTGIVPNVHKQRSTSKENGQILPKPALNPEGLQALIAVSESWMRTEKKLSLEETSKHLGLIPTYVACKIADLNRPSRSSSSKDVIQGIRATSRSIENAAKVGSTEGVEMGANLPVGYVDTVKNRVHAGHGWWIERSPYDLLRRKINITPRKFILNAAVLIFGEHVLKKSSVTGIVPNVHKRRSASKGNGQILPKPALNPEGMQALIAVSEHWMQAEKKLSHEETSRHLGLIPTYVACKIADLNRPSRSLSSKDGQNTSRSSKRRRFWSTTNVDDSDDRADENESDERSLMQHVGDASGNAGHNQSTHKKPRIRSGEIMLGISMEQNSVVLKTESPDEDIFASEINDGVQNSTFEGVGNKGSVDNVPDLTIKDEMETWIDEISDCETTVSNDIIPENMEKKLVKDDIFAHFDEMFTQTPDADSQRLIIDTGCTDASVSSSEVPE